MNEKTSKLARINTFLSVAVFLLLAVDLTWNIAHRYKEHKEKEENKTKKETE